MRTLLPLALALATVVAPALSAQSVFDSELRLAPQFMQYQIKSPSNETISELAVPVFVSIPFGSRFTFDVGTSYARAKVTTGSTLSEINGLTDTQLRGNLTLGTDFVVITGGVNLPTGQSSVTLDQLTAAGRIGSDFLAFPISNMGTGLATTGGIAIARPFGDWNFGFGGAVRRSSTYDPYNVPGPTLRFTPGDEYRARVGVDRGLNNGRLSLGLTYSAFGKDDAGGSVYNTGNRLIAQAVVTNSISGADVTLAGYNVFRAPGQYASLDPAGRENIANGYLGIGLHMLGTLVEPSIEGRHWLQNIPGVTSGSTTTADRSQSSYLGTFGLRTRIGVGGLAAFPSVGYTIGQLATLDAQSTPVHADFTGFRAQLAIRVAP
ncbi:MAG TPA: hypothetical protein VIJ90_02680 [Gemmatimonadaceae bacterium]